MSDKKIEKNKKQIKKVKTKLSAKIIIIETCKT